MSQLVLASASPRRRELLETLGLEFEVSPADLDESLRPGEGAAAYVERLAQEKAALVATRRPNRWIVAADTAVVVDGECLGKPVDDGAVGGAMLRRLSGRLHEVMTGVAVVGPSAWRSSTVVVTQVRFRALHEREIAWYVATGEGRDKAGGYAVQGRAGAFVTSLEGSSTNVIGLPLAETVGLLAQAGFVLPWEVRP